MEVARSMAAFGDGSCSPDTHHCIHSITFTCNTAQKHTHTQVHLLEGFGVVADYRNDSGKNRKNDSQ